MKYIILFLIALIPFSLNAQQINFLGNIDCTILQNEKYGDNELNNFDIILPKSNKPTALIIFIHGGGFVNGDKDECYKWRKEDVTYFLKNNIAYATINYRFYKSNDAVGVNKCLTDIKTALQYIRFNAKKYNINKELIGCYGISAGAGSSLYLAFHDDMAIKNDKSLLGESTRIKCAGAIATQATYDVFRWLKFIPNLKLVVTLKKKQFYNTIANFYGYPDYKSFEPDRAKKTQQLDMLQMITPDDPPIYVMNLQKERFPVNYGIIEHHREHAMILDSYLRKQNIEHKVFIYSKKIKTENDINVPLKEFMVNHLK